MGYLSSLLKSYYDGDEKQGQEGQGQTQDGLGPLPSSLPTPTSSSIPSSPSSTSPTSLPTSIPTIPATASTPTDTTATTTTDLYTNPRARLIKQVSLFALGAAAVTTSALITRRAVFRKLKVTTPRHFTPSNHKPTDANGAAEAAEAFALATINVASVGLLLTGGAMFALDVVSAEDLRRRYRAKMGFVDAGIDEQGGDEEIEQWVKSVLDKKDNGDYKGVAEGLTALVGVIAGKEEEKLGVAGDSVVADSDDKAREG